MDRTLKSLSLTLSYPTQDLKAAMQEIGDVFDSDRRLSGSTRKSLRQLAQELRSRDIYELEERYVGLFDRSRTLSLNLFEHVHGESRDRGGAMVSLLETYRAGGFDLATTELPDHLPVVLEFLSMRPRREAQEVLADAAHILEALSIRHSRRKSPFCGVFAALLELSGTKADRSAVTELLGQPEVDPDNLDALDEIWEESEVRFGPDPGAGCPQARDILARIDEPGRQASGAATQ
ncbi:MAG: nitrate reductase molybdenum cofactor assembly chaperone [Boseongicola sp.]|nr:nitrate reductase molybdenum cofactor assembly chaperone [Boseongicola sp.]MYI70681.1 nitrate reductase molybdenum cofactor assembly chaperone [Boseongicola sp. SB0673_bin_14]